MDHAGCLRCGETRETQRRSPCQGRRLQSHDWYIPEYAICRDVGGPNQGFGTTKVLALRYPVRPQASLHRTAWPADYGWGSSTQHGSRFLTVDEAITCIDALGLTGVDIRRCEYPTSPERLPVMWPPQAQAGVAP